MESACESDEEAQTGEARTVQWPSWGEFEVYLREQGLQVELNPPEVLDDRLVGSVCFLWNIGWSTGDITTMRPSRLELRHRFKFAIQHLGEGKPRTYWLSLDSYAAGDGAPEGSWLFL